MSTQIVAPFQTGVNGFLVGQPRQAEPTCVRCGRVINNTWCGLSLCCHAEVHWPVVREDPSDQWWAEFRIGSRIGFAGTRKVEPSEGEAIFYGYRAARKEFLGRYACADCGGTGWVELDPDYLPYDGPYTWAEPGGYGVCLCCDGSGRKPDADAEGDDYIAYLVDMHDNAEV